MDIESQQQQQQQEQPRSHNGAHRALWFGGAVVLLHIVSAIAICAAFDDKANEDSGGSGGSGGSGDNNTKSGVVKKRRTEAACGAAVVATVLATVYVASGVHKANGLWCKIMCGVAIGLVLMHLMYTLYLHRPGPGRFKHHEVMKLYEKLNKKEGDDPKKMDEMDTYYTKTRWIHFMHGLLSTVVFAAFLGVEDEWWK